ncbi:hypothetical protein EH30_00125 [Erythrobacter sp. JL475]|nr:hypothetical protein EH30_00125 [Erythrobacter sp. JL475]
MWEYSSAASKYSRAESRARAIKADLRDQRDAYLAFLVIFFVFFALTFLPWGKWVRLFSQGVNNTVTRSGAAVESIASQVSGENRTIIKREGLDRYSVSTELRNWKALLDEGVVTREEFEKAKAKILNGG